MKHNVEILEDYRNQVQIEIDSNSQIGAFILSHNYLEHFIREILKLKLKNKDKNNSSQHVQKIVDKIGRIKYFNQLLYLFTTNLTLDQKIHNQIEEINQFRNNLSHKSITMDIQSETFKKKIKTKIKLSLELCEELEKMLENEIFESIKPQLIKLSKQSSLSFKEFQTINKKLKDLSELPKGIKKVNKELTRIPENAKNLNKKIDKFSEKFKLLFRK